MKLKNFARNTISVICISILFSTLCFSQFFCDLDNRNNLLPNTNSFEYSGLAFHPERGIFIMPLDDPINGNIYFKGYNISAGGNSSFNIAILNAGLLTKDDLEGLTYLNEDYFVLVEEKENKIYFLKYNQQGSGNPYFEILSGHNTGIPLARNNKDGLEGITYDPHTNQLYVIREHSEIELFNIPITLPTSGFQGDISEHQIGSVILPIDEDENGDKDASGLFHLGKVFPVTNDMSKNILIVSHVLNKIMEFKLILDSNNNLNSNSLVLAKEMQIPNEPQPEGIAVYDNKIFIASEKAGGGLSSYAVNPTAVPCNTDCTKGEIEVWNPVSCNCEPLPTAGCTDSNACNFDESATVDDCSCVYKYSRCDDGNEATINDIINENCICKGIPACQCQNVNKTE